jgi:hypothetical protein
MQKKMLFSIFSSLYLGRVGAGAWLSLATFCKYLKGKKAYCLELFVLNSQTLHLSSAG